MKLPLLCVHAACILPVAAATHHVDLSVAAPGDGSSWSAAFANLQDALAAASSTDVILVASGTYYPDEGGSAVADDRGSTFQLIDGVSLEGGYPPRGGTRDLSAHLTILSGDLDQNDSGAPAGNNSHSVVTASGTTASAVLDGFLITGGLADGPGTDAFDGPIRAGAGLFADSGSPTVVNCTFANNAAGFGGGAFCIDSSSPVFTNCIFSGNLAGFFGGALNNRDGSSPVLINCTLTGNSAGSSAGGGAISNFSFCNPTLTNSIVWNNLESGNTSTPEASINDSSTTVFHHSLIQNLAPGGTNPDGTDPDSAPSFLIPVPPAEAPTLAGDLRLAIGSPALDAGDNAANSETTDRAGAPRIQATTIDLGALEGAFEPVIPPVLHVDASVAVAGDGSSWANAFATLQDALAATVAEQQILVAAGTYYPDEGGGAAGNDRNATFQLKNTIEIIGGHPPGGGLRDLAAHPTFLSGDIDQNDSGAPTGGNSHSVVTGSGVDNSAILDGFIITGGLANAVPASPFTPTDAGGAFFSDAGSPTLLDCIIRGNSATFGGAVFNINGASPRFVNCAFSGNQATAFGGALNNRDDSSPVLVNCTVTGNSAGSGGGALSNFSISTPTLTNCIVWNNQAAGSTSTASASISDGTSSTTFQFSLVQNLNPGGNNLNGNHFANTPYFVDPVDPATAPTAAGDLRLFAGSSAIDAGINAANPRSTDLGGGPRIQDGTIDLGAFEGGFTPPDSDGDGLSDEFELAHTDPPSATSLAPDSNLDGDAFTALEEFAFGLDPNVPNAAGAALQAVSVNQGGTLYFAIGHRRDPAALALVEITAERSTDLGLSDPWSPDDLVPFAAPEPFIGYRSTHPEGTLDSEFLRLRVEKR